MPQESFWFLYIVLHKYLFYLCICQGHKYVEEHRYTFQLLICAAADVAGFDWTNSLPQTAELLSWIRSSVHVSDCHTGPCVLSIGIGIKWYFLPPPQKKKLTKKMWKVERKSQNLTQEWRAFTANPDVMAAWKRWEACCSRRTSKEFFKPFVNEKEQSGLCPQPPSVSLGKPLTETCCTPTSSSTRSHHLWLFDTSGHNSYFAISMQSNFCHNYCRVDSRVRQSPAPWACLCFPLGVKPLKQPFSIQQSQVRALCHG